ncbi:hypothetical protein KUW09_12605 [Mameliella alba]|nr:hypothetical protein [Antarctobacter heliothermus]MBY6144891.1 hypothetical protein [Mameliella alba]MCA0956031.1 hypothetical protein [Mameliella alba]
MKSILPALMLLGSPALAGQYCEIDGTERFACTFNNGAKAVEVCDAIWQDGMQATYGYFAPGKAPELELSMDMASIYYVPWNGMTRVPNASVTFRSEDGAYGYEVWYEGEDGGINVSRDNEVLATLVCDPGTVTQDLDALIERIEAAQVSP